MSTRQIISHIPNSSLENNNKEDGSDELSERQSDETGGTPDTSPADAAAQSMTVHDPVDAYKRAAPQLLHELAHLLSQYKWAEKACIPRGIVNILNYSWQDLTAGTQTDKSGESKRSLELDKARFRPASAHGKTETGQRNSRLMEIVGLSVGKSQVNSSKQIKRRKQRGKLIFLWKPGCTKNLNLRSKICHI